MDRLRLGVKRCNSGGCDNNLRLTARTRLQIPNERGLAGTRAARNQNNGRLGIHRRKRLGNAGGLLVSRIGREHDAACRCQGFRTIGR